MPPGKPKIEWQPILAEFIGTGLLLLLGLSLVIFMFGEGTPAAGLIPDRKVRQSITGFIFGCVGSGIAVSPLGRVSGAHINPVVTLGFRLLGKLDMRTTIGYIVAQVTGAVVGCLPLLAWGSIGRSVNFGATTPGIAYTTQNVLIGEIVTTFMLIVTLCVFIAYRKIRSFTPAVTPFLYAVMVPLEADISGTSTNPARSFGPSLVSGVWDGWWIYWVGPIIGMVLAIIACSYFARRIEVAKLYHFESDDRRFFPVKASKSELASP